TVNSIHVHDVEQEASSGYCLAFECDLTSTLQLPAGAADQDVRYVIVLVLIRVAHIGSVKNQGMIQQRSVAVRDSFQFLSEVGHFRYVISSDHGVTGNRAR